MPANVRRSTLDEPRTFAVRFAGTQERLYFIEARSDAVAVETALGFRTQDHRTARHPYSETLCEVWTVETEYDDSRVRAPIFTLVPLASYHLRLTRGEVLAGWGTVGKAKQMEDKLKSTEETP